MTDTKPTIDEQITALRNLEGPIAKAAADNLERLRAIDAVKVPEEPIKDEYECYDHYVDSLKDYIDTLRDLLKRESARADDLQKLHENKYTLMTGNALAYMKQRAEAAESKLAAIENDRIRPLCDKMMEELK